MKRLYHKSMDNARVVNLGESIGFDVRRMVLRYLKNLLQNWPIDDQYCDTLLACLDEAGFRTFADGVVKIWKSDTDRRRVGIRVDEFDLRSRSSFSRSLEDLLVRGALKGGEEALREVIGTVIERELDRDPVAGFRQQLDELQEIFRLEEEELLVMVFLYTIDQFTELERLLDLRGAATKISTAARATGLPVGVIRAAFSSRGRLAMNGLIDEDGMGRRDDYPDIEPAVREFLSGFSGEGLREKFVRRDEGRRYPAASFRIPAASLEIMQDLLRRPGRAQLLLYGRPGTGKTELARSMAAAAGKTAFFLNDDNEENRRRNSSRAALLAAAEKVSADNAILVVDEADKTLNTRPVGFFLFGGESGEQERGKEWLNNFMDGTQAKIIWITNKIGGIEDSVKRRFDFSLEFRDFDRQQRLLMWRIQLKEQDLTARLGRRALERLAAEYPVNAGTIATALKGAGAMVAADAGEVRLLAVLEEILARQLELQGIGRIRDAVSVGRTYDAAALHLDTDRTALETSLTGFSRYLENAPAAEQRNMNCLFWGPSGTGKTEYARYLAGRLGRELIIKRASDLIDPYVGMTEKHIRRAFQEASRQEAILFIDEADSFLRTREKASHSWELSFVNEFLTNMESFRGILICCTNLMEELDPASLRRFQWKIGFQPLKAEGRERLYKKFFGSGTGRERISESVCKRLANMDGLVPGDYKAVSVRLGFLPPAGRGSELILDELAKEIALRSGKKTAVGFNT